MTLERIDELEDHGMGDLVAPGEWYQLLTLARRALEQPSADVVEMRKITDDLTRIQARLEQPVPTGEVAKADLERLASDEFKRVYTRAWADEQSDERRGYTVDRYSADDLHECHDFGFISGYQRGRESAQGGWVAARTLWAYRVLAALASRALVKRAWFAWSEEAQLKEARRLFGTLPDDVRSTLGEYPPPPSDPSKGGGT